MKEMKMSRAFFARRLCFRERKRDVISDKFARKYRLLFVSSCYRIAGDKAAQMPRKCMAFGVTSLAMFRKFMILNAYKINLSAHLCLNKYYTYFQRRNTKKVFA